MKKCLFLKKKKKLSSVRARETGKVKEKRAWRQLHHSLHGSREDDDRNSSQAPPIKIHLRGPFKPKSCKEQLKTKAEFCTPKTLVTSTKQEERTASAALNTYVLRVFALVTTS